MSRCLPPHPRFGYRLRYESGRSGRFQWAGARALRKAISYESSSAGLGRYYVLPACVPHLAEQAARGDYPFCVPPASRCNDYDPARVCPNAVSFMETFVRWFWTEKYTDRHLEQMAAIIRDVCEKNRGGEADAT